MENFIGYKCVIFRDKIQTKRIKLAVYPKKLKIYSSHGMAEAFIELFHQLFVYLFPR